MRGRIGHIVDFVRQQVVERPRRNADPDAQGGGVGRRLLTASVEWFRTEGVPEATLWVFEANRRGRAF